MKNFTNNFKQFTSRLSARWLIMALMLLLGTSTAWAGGFWGDNAWNIKFDSPSQGKDMWINDNYDAGHGNGSTIDLGTFSSAPYLKGYWAKTWGYGNDTNKFVKITFNNTTTDSGVSKQWNSDGDQMWKSESLNIKFPDTEGSHEESITFAINGAETMTCKIKYKICTSCCTNYYLQHPWNGGNWTWKELKKEDCNNNIYTLTANYGNAGCDYSKPGVQEKQDYIANPILEGDPKSGDECIFTFDANNKTITITKVVTCNDNPDFSVSLSKSEVAVGCTGVTASITGNDSPTVTWSSSSTNVATINSSTGAITIKAAGTTTITATTTEDGGFCGGVEKKATLTVISPSVTVKENDNSLCEGETLTLTATLTNCGTGNSIQWYKGEDLLTGETKDQLTISSVTTTNSGEYKAVVTGGIICSSIESSAVAITVNARPNAPSLSNPEAICQGTTFTLPEKDDSKKTITWNVNNRELTNLSVGPHTYTAKIVENGCESTTVDYTITVKEQLAKPVLEITNVKQCGSNYTAGKIVISNHDPNNTYILKKDGNPINKAYNDGYSVSENEKGTYTVEVSKDGACGATSDDVTIEVINNTPTVTPFEITKQANVCMGNPVTLSYDGTAQSGDISYAWYEGANNEVLGTESSLEIAQAKNTTYKLKITVTANDCSADKETTITIEPKQRPAKPTFNSDEMSVCAGQQFNLPIPNNLPDEDDVYGLWTVGGYATTQSQTLDAAEDYKYTAYINNGCPSEGTDFTVHVNPLPAITGISVNNSTPVINEDVLLTVEGSDIARVEWSITSGNNASLSDASGNSVKLTSTASGTVTVTATATSAVGCESTIATKTVTFGAEDCSKSEVTTESTKIEIWCRETGSSQAGSNLTCYAWYNDGSNHDLNSDNTNKGTETSVTKTSNIEGQEYTYRVWEFDMQKYGDYDVYVIFKKSTTAWDWQTSDLTAGKRNNRYFFTYDGSQHDQSKRGEKYSKSESLSVTTKTITAPAVKTVSATSEQGSGVVEFTGQIIKTGCAATSKIYYGYQFKKADEEWPTTGVEASNTPVEGKLIPLTNASETALYYQFSANVENLEDVDYHFRAYIINGYDFTNGNYDQGVYYGLDKLVTVRNTKTAISNVTLDYCNEDGEDIDDPNSMCKGAIAYVKLDYTGSKYSDIKWLVEGVETNLVTDEGDGVWSYEIQGDGNLSVELKNDANTDPAWPYSNKLPFTIIPEPTAPYISIDPASGIICQGTPATIMVENPSTDCSYKLVEEGSKAGFEPYKSGDLIYKVQIEGKYYVVAQHNACTDNEYTSNQVAINQIISTNANISIDPAKAETTPWEPVTITVKPDAGYIYELTYTDGNLAAVDGVRIKQNGDSYTYYIPRPWDTGDSNPVRTPINYGIKAQLKVDGEASQCQLNAATAIIQLKDEDNEDCDK